MLLRLLTSLFVILTFFGCKKPMNEIGRDKKDLERRLREGDVDAYYQLQILYLDYKSEDFIPYAKFMADTLNYAPANLDVFEAYIGKYHFREDNVFLDSMNKEDRSEAIIYLQRSRALKVGGVSEYDYVKISD